jgi:large subunit ribosomal protein L22
MATEGDIRARARFVLQAPQKVRLVIDLVRGKPATEALELLRFTSKAAAGPVGKVLRSAIANAEQNFGVSQDDLVVDQIWADEGPTRRWRRFGARGRFKPILRRTSHITVVLRSRAQAAG